MGAKFVMFFGIFFYNVLTNLRFFSLSCKRILIAIVWHGMAWYGLCRCLANAFEWNIHIEANRWSHPLRSIDVCVVLLYIIWSMTCITMHSQTTEQKQKQQQQHKNETMISKRIVMYTDFSATPLLFKMIIYC